MKVFLGGTCNDSQWRNDLKPLLAVDYFDPVVEDWTPEAQRQELYERETCDFVLYTITPRMTGVYSIAEVVDDSNKRPEKTIFCVLLKDGNSEFSPGQAYSLGAVTEMVRRNGGHVCRSLHEVASYLNTAMSPPVDPA